jgi:hypothetical protein
MNCTFCQKEITEKKIHFRDDCPACDRDLHICLNCEFYDSNAYRQCRESIRELVQDKERANYCDFFRQSTGGSGQADAENDAMNKLDDLFK